MSPVKDADPKAQSLDEAFGAAMNAPAKPRVPAAPPERDDDAPHGRDEKGEPLAPYGFTKDGKVKKSPAGRKRNPDDAARITKPGEDPAPGQPGTGALPPHDYRVDLTDFADSVWVGMTFASQMPLNRIPLIGAVPIGNGRKLGEVLAGAETRLAAQAYLFERHKGGLVAGLNVAAQHNTRARRLADKLEGGDITWVITCAALVVPFLAQSRAMWSGDQETLGVTVQQLADQNRATFQEWITKVTAVIEAQAQLEQAAGPAAAAGGQAPDGAAAAAAGGIPAAALCGSPAAGGSGGEWTRSAP